MTISGVYVKTFAEASHALPQGMHMNADYPFMLPPIVRIDRGSVVLHGSQGDATFRIMRENDQEYCVISQSSSFEQVFSRKPTKFKTLPFKDSNTATAGGST